MTRASKSAVIDRSRQLVINAAETEVLAVLKANPRNKITIDLGEDEGGCITFPLLHNSRLLGAIFVYYSHETGIPKKPYSISVSSCCATTSLSM